MSDTMIVKMNSIHALTGLIKDNFEINTTTTSFGYHTELNEYHESNTSSTTVEEDGL